MSTQSKENQINHPTVVTYEITRKVQVSTDYVKNYDVIDSFSSLVAARKYYKELRKILDEKKVEGNSFNYYEFRNKLFNVVHKFGLNKGCDDILDVEDTIVRKTTRVSTKELKA